MNTDQDSNQETNAKRRKPRRDGRLAAVKTRVGEEGTASGLNKLGHQWDIINTKKEKQENEDAQDLEMNIPPQD